MKSIVKTLWLTANIALAGMYVLASLSTFIPPASFSFISIGTLAFPYLLVGFILAIIINFFAHI